MPADTVTFTLRLPRKLHERQRSRWKRSDLTDAASPLRGLISVVAATGNEVTRSGLCVQALEQLLAQLAVCPGMVEGYDPGQDKAARRMERRNCRGEKGKTGE